MDSPKANVSTATPVLHLDTSVSTFNAFVSLVNKGTEAVGDLVYQTRELLNKLLDNRAEGSQKTILTMLLLDTVDVLHTAAPAAMPFMPPHPGGNPDDDPGFGGGGDEPGDKPTGCSRRMM